MKLKIYLKQIQKKYSNSVVIFIEIDDDFIKNCIKNSPKFSTDIKSQEVKII